ncbi:hypothetical protein [Actinospica robiniae]|uniref:hypothetical protein n=1 Tax=Actinospica robiniae TaxID=304901 RepID=UPI0003FE7F11|nr:hypothetical protein [Actinospica robiniae]
MSTGDGVDGHASTRSRSRPSKSDPDDPPHPDAPAETDPAAGRDSDAESAAQAPSETEASSSPDAPSETDVRSDPDPDPGAVRSRGSKAPSRARRERRRRRVFGATAAALVVALLFGIGRIPAVRTVLRQSFTRMSSPAPAIYFTADPTVDGAVLHVPLALDPHASGTTTFTVKAWLVTGSGSTGPTLSAKVTARGTVVKTVLDVLLPKDPEVVWVSLAGADGQTLHYRIAGNPIPTATAY